MQRLVRGLLLGGLAGKALGVIREVVAAWCFGTGVIANSYRMAQAATLLPLHGFLSDVTSGAFTPLYARLRTERPAEAQRLFGTLHALLLFAGILVAAALIALAPLYVELLAPGFSVEASALTVKFIRILAFALPAYVVITIYCAAEMVHGESRITAARASFQSVGLTVGTIVAWALSAPWLIAIGFASAYWAFAIWGCRYCSSIGLSFRVRRSEWRVALRELLPIWKVFRVLMWVPIALQVSQVVERRIASGIHPGAVAGLDYARFASETLLILVAMPFGMAGQASMPTMSESEFRAKTARALTAMAIIGIPLSVFLVIHSEPLVSLIFQRGAFDAQSVKVTAQIMSGQSLGLAFLLMAYAGQKFLNARGRNAVVLRSTLAGVVVSVASNSLLSGFVGPAILGLSAALAGVAVTASVLKALGQVRSIVLGLRWWWFVAAIHLIAVVGFRRFSASHWASELAFGVAVWAGFLAFHRPSRLLLRGLVATGLRAGK